MYLYNNCIIHSSKILGATNIKDENEYLLSVCIKIIPIYNTKSEYNDSRACNFNQLKC